jgi:signal transduction histidine kinase
VHTAREGIERAAEQIPAAIILANKAAKLSAGPIRDLRAEAELASVPVIVVGSKMTYADARKWLDAGADDCLDTEDVAKLLVGTIKKQIAVRETAGAATERAMETLRYSITAAMPHELRTALVGILGYASMLREDSASLTPADIRDMAGYIERSAQRMQRHVESFAWFSRLRTQQLAGKSDEPAHKHICDTPAEIIENIAFRHAEMADRVGDLVVEIEDAPVQMYEEYLEKILIEVIDNAFKFSNHGTPVRVRSLNEGGYVVEVSDEGRGMSAEQIRQVGAYMQFEREVYEQQGAGMGLTIALSLAELYGGHVNIKSSVGKGTTVRVTFPLAGPNP